MKIVPPHGGSLAASRRAFTLVELMVSSVLVVAITGLLITVVAQTSNIWRRTTGKIEQFKEARNAFESVTTRLAQATLNTYIDYDSAANPTKYLRRSELRFISGPADQLLGAPPAKHLRSTHATFFAAPLGETSNIKYTSFENMICSSGYFVEVASDEDFRPRFLTENIIPPRYRPRLIEFLQPAENNLIYSKTSVPSSVPPASALADTYRYYEGKEWFATGVNGANPPVHVAAENIIAFLVVPRLAPVDEAEIKGATSTDPDSSPLAPKYFYDSHPVKPGVATTDTRYKDGRLNPVNQLPPMLQVTMVAVDEATAQNLGYKDGNLDPFNLATKFNDTKKYSAELLYSGDNDSLENRLIALRANYRIFSSNVVIRAAKWSREQTN